jgi:hypothetical protein
MKLVGPKIVLCGTPISDISLSELIVISVTSQSTFQILHIAPAVLQNLLTMQSHPR